MGRDVNFQVVSDHGFDVVDLHYAFRRQTHHRAVDGVHWDGIVHRAITNLLLWHVSDAWHVELPAPDSWSYSSLWNEPQQQQQQSQSLMHLNDFDSSSRHDDCDEYSNDSGLGFYPQQNDNPSQRNVDFPAEDFNTLDNDYTGFGSYPHISEQKSNRVWSVCRTILRHFGSDLTNGRRRQPMVARRGNGNLRNNRRRPY